MFDLKKYYQPDQECGWLPRPNMRGTHPGFGAAFTTNSRGLRDREYTVPKPPGVRRVVVLGDSFAWGHGVADDEVFTEVLEQRLPDTEIVNLGVTGFNLEREFRYLQRVGMRYEPQVVIVAVCQNDIPAHAVHAAAESKKRDESPPVARARIEGPRPGHFRPVKQFLNSHSCLYAWCIECINSHRFLTLAAVRIGLKEELAGFEKLDNNLYAALIDCPPRIADAMEQTQADILRLDSYARSHDARLLLALIPSLQAVDRRALTRTLAYTRYDTSDFDLDKPYRVLGRFAARHGIVVCNPLEAFRKRRRHGEELFLRNDMHFAPSGHRAFADEIEPLLTALLKAQLAETSGGGTTSAGDLAGTGSPPEPAGQHRQHP